MPEVMKQLAAVQGILESTSGEVFRHHRETHLAKAISEGRGDQIVDELMEALKFDNRVLRMIPNTVKPHPVDTPGARS